MIARALMSPWGQRYLDDFRCSTAGRLMQYIAVGFWIGTMIQQSFGAGRATVTTE